MEASPEAGAHAICCIKAHSFLLLSCWACIGSPNPQTSEM